MNSRISWSNERKYMVSSRCREPLYVWQWFEVQTLGTVVPLPRDNDICKLQVELWSIILNRNHSWGVYIRRLLLFCIAKIETEFILRTVNIVNPWFSVNSDGDSDDNISIPKSRTTIVLVRTLYLVCSVVEYTSSRKTGQQVRWTSAQYLETGTMTSQAVSR